MQFATEAERQRFNCATCPDKVKKLRRCAEDRYDFTSEDANLFPIKLNNEYFGFCPAKATWDTYISDIYNILIITAETGQLLTKGAIEDQPSWFVDLLSWFLKSYNDYKFFSRAKAILGDSKPSEIKGLVSHGNFKKRP